MQSFRFFGIFLDLRNGGLKHFAQGYLLARYFPETNLVNDKLRADLGCHFLIVSVLQLFVLLT